MFTLIGALGWAEAQEAPNIPTLPDVPFEYADVDLPPHFERNTAFDNTPDDNPITNEGATLGRVLFYDRRLSANDSISCASCHHQERAFADFGAVSEGFEGEQTTRNSMGLSNARFYPRGHFLWGEEAETLEDQVLLPVDSEVELGLGRDNLPPKLEATTFYAGLFEDAFGSTDITIDRISRALAQFIRSLDSGGSKFDEGVAVEFANFNESETLGQQVFVDRCASCHSTELQIALREPTNNGSDLTLADPGAGEGRFKVPSLRNIELTGPYMHDGSIETLEEVVEHYNSRIPADNELISFPLGGPMRLSDEEKTGLVDFMKTMTDPAFIADVRFSDPFVQVANEPPFIGGVDEQGTFLGADYLLELEVTDLEGDPVALLIDGLPPGLELSQVGQVITGSPTETGSFPVTLVAEDPFGTSQIEFTIQVIDVEVDISVACGADGIATVAVQLFNPLTSPVFYELLINDEAFTVPVDARGSGSVQTTTTSRDLFVNAVRLTSPTVGVVALTAAQPIDCPGQDQVMHVVSCLAGNGRVDTNIVNGGTEPATFVLRFEGLSPRQVEVPAGDWWRMPITGRSDRDYEVVVERNGETISSRTVVVACDLEPPFVDSDEVRVVNACRAGNGYIIFQFVNPTAERRSWTIEFTSVANRSTSAQPFGAAVRAVTGRPSGTYPVTIRANGSFLESFEVEVDC